jgi:hypothetical protein
MKRTVIFFISFVLIALTTDAETYDHGIRFSEGTDETGGPDDFGYTWIDSNEPGGPIFQWIDITAVGDSITGMGDDVCVGPFDPGFALQYYWYQIDELYIGSNGYIKFTSPANVSQPFPETIPLTSDPNDFIAPYMADWFPGQGGQGSAYFWTNSADSCIVSFLDYPAYLAGGSHTFQVILTNSDSSITFQYADQQGLVLNNDILIGIEAANGQVGLEHSHDQYIAWDDFVIRYEYPEEITYEVHDMAAIAVANENSAGFFQLLSGSYSPWGAIKNFGNEPEIDYTVTLSIESELGTVLYTQIIAPLSPMYPGEVHNLDTWPTTWSPPEIGQYFVVLSVDLSGDMNPANDTIRTECHVMELPGTMFYDDSTAEIGWRWEGGEGSLAQRFVPPAYYAKLDSFAIYIALDNGSTPFTAEIIDDDGVDGSPGTVLYTTEITAPTEGFYGVNIASEEIIIYEGAFYIAWSMNGERTPGIGLDLSPEQLGSRQAWEYTGSWSQFRNAETSDPMIHCTISYIQPPNFPPEIVAHYPTQLDTMIQHSFQEFWISVDDPYEDSLFYEWRLDGIAIGHDSTMIIHFEENDVYEVIGWVSDGEYSDSVTWQIDVQVGIKGDDAQNPPQDFSLFPISPNPFNLTTTVNYQTDRSGHVHMNVYNLSGQRVATLFDGWQYAGRHHVEFQALDFVSGIYIIRLSSDARMASQKAVLLK